MSCGLGFWPHGGNGSILKGPSVCLHSRISNKFGLTRLAYLGQWPWKPLRSQGRAKGCRSCLEQGEVAVEVHMACTEMCALKGPCQPVQGSGGLVQEGSLASQLLSVSTCPQPLAFSCQRGEKQLTHCTDEATEAQGKGLM